MTRPIQYAKHRNSQRVYITLALTWIVSVAVSLPIPLGMNYTTRRSRTPWLCILYNSDFIIFSSMTSFYVPCVLMIFLYWRTLRAISARANRKRKSVEVTTTSSGSTRTRAVDVELQRQQPAASTVVVHAVVNGPSPDVDATAVASTPIFSERKDSATKFPDYHTMHSCREDEQPTTATTDVDGGLGDTSLEEGGARATTSVAGDVDDTEMSVQQPASQRQRRHRRFMVVQPVHDSLSPTRRSKQRGGSGKTIVSGLRMRRSAIFAFGLQRLAQKPEKLSTKRERKATQTLAIVLGMSKAPEISCLQGGPKTTIKNYH